MFWLLRKVFYFLQYSLIGPFVLFLVFMRLDYFLQYFLCAHTVFQFSNKLCSQILVISLNNYITSLASYQPSCSLM